MFKANTALHGKFCNFSLAMNQQRNFTLEPSTQGCTLMYCIVHVFAQSPSHVPLFATPWTIACQGPLFMEFSRQE